MTGFLYYVPGVDKISRESAQSLGIGHAFDTPPVCRSVMANGPDGGRGCVAADRSLGSAVRLDPGTQVWRPAPVEPAPAAEGEKPVEDAPKPSPAYWLGYFRDDPPTPDDLVRERQLDGKVIEFASGHRWHVPRLREWPEGHEWPSWSTRIPRRADLDDAGEWVYGDVLNRYREIWDWAGAVSALISQNLEQTGRAELDQVGDACRFVVKCLETNYRVSRLEIVTMGLTPAVDALKVVEYAVDAEGLRNQLGEHLRNIKPEKHTNADETTATEKQGA